MKFSALFLPRVKITLFISTGLVEPAKF